MKRPTIKLCTEQGDTYEVPEGGSLGLLALGYKGVMLWREKRGLSITKKEKQNEKV